MAPYGVRHVSDLVLKGVMTEAAVDDVVAAGLAGYAVAHLESADPGASVDPGHPRPGEIDPRLQRSRLINSVRHATVRRVVADLVSALREVRIESLLLKGFYLAEFVYPDPTWRPYSDVDVALRGPSGTTAADVALTAATIAARLGWEVIWHLGEPSSVHSHHDADYNGHELLLLRHGDLGIALDAHRRLVHSNVSSWRVETKSEAMTSKVWAAAQPLRLIDAEVLAPSFVDSVLVGLVAGRSWSGDRYVLRPHDLLDMKYLMQRGSLDQPVLFTRAEELGMVKTTRLFLRRCDPDAETLDLRTPGVVETFWYDTYLMTERGHRGVQRFVSDLATFPERASAVLGELPHMRRLLRQSQAGTLPAPVAAQPGPASDAVGTHLDKRTWRRTQQAVRRAMQVLGKEPCDDPAATLAGLSDAVRRRGHRVTLRDDGTRLQLEHEGRALHPTLLFPSTAPAAEAGAAGVHDGPRLPASDGPRRPRQPAPALDLVLRLKNVGVSGLLLRAEALLYLWRIRGLLRTTTFTEVRDRMVNGVSSPVPSGAHGSVTSDVTVPTAASREKATTPDASAVGRAVESAARFVPGAQCVAQSLAGQVMLARRDVHSAIHFGFVRSPAGSVTGHAWLEADGAVVTGDVGLDGFTRTALFEA